MNYSNLVYTGINSAATWYICYSLVLSDIKYRSKNELSLYDTILKEHTTVYGLGHFFGCHQMIVLLEVSWGCKIILKSFSSVMHFIESVEKRYDIQTLYDRLHCLVRVTTCQKKIIKWYPVLFFIFLLLLTQFKRTFWNTCINSWNKKKWKTKQNTTQNVNHFNKSSDV